MRFSAIFAMIFCVFMAVSAPVDASAIHKAISRGDISTVRKLISKDKTLVNQHATKFFSSDLVDASPLHWAAYFDHLEITELLLKNGAKINSADQKGFTPIQIAHSRGNEDVVALLKKHGAKLGAVAIKDKPKPKPQAIATKKAPKIAPKIAKTEPGPPGISIKPATADDKKYAEQKFSEYRAPSKYPVEYQLASLDAGSKYISTDDPCIYRYKYLVDSIASKTSNTREEIGDITYNAQDLILKERGRKMKLIDILEQGNIAMPDNGQKYKYSEVLALLVAIMK